MNTRTFLATTAAAALFFGGAVTANAQSLTITSVSVNYTAISGSPGSCSNCGGGAGSFIQTSGSDSTTNAGNVTMQTLPDTVSLSTKNSPNFPLNPILAVNPPSGISEGTLALTLGLKDANGVSFSETYDGGYFANSSTDTDCLNWQSTTITSCTGTMESSFPTASGNGNLLATFTEDGNNYALTLSYETDWNMAQYAGFEWTGSTTTVPEPASMVLFGSGLVGLVAIRRRMSRKARKAA
jgi:hypothetical protein